MVDAGGLNEPNPCICGSKLSDAFCVENAGDSMIDLPYGGAERIVSRAEIARNRNVLRAFSINNAVSNVNQ